MSEPLVVCDFFLEVNGQDHICEIYDTEDGHVTDYGMYPLLEDGSKGEPIEEPGEEIDQRVQELYYCWVNQVFEN